MQPKTFPACPRPEEGSPALAILLPWVGARASTVHKYVQLYQALGCDVAVFPTHPLSMWFPAWASANAARVLTWLQAQLAQQRRPVIFVAFSGAAKACYCAILRLLAGADGPPSVPQQVPHGSAAGAPQHAGYGTPAGDNTRAPATASTAPPPRALDRALLRSCVAGQVLDSCPVDFTSEAGTLLVAPDASTPLGWASRWAAACAASTLDFFLLERFEQQRQQMWQSLETHGSRYPTLFLYSWDDPLADAQRIHGLAATMQHRCPLLLQQAWDGSEHVGHLRRHPERYHEMTEHFVATCLQRWLQQQGSHSCPPKACNVSSSGSSSSSSTDADKGSPAAAATLQAIVTAAPAASNSTTAAAVSPGHSRRDDIITDTAAATGHFSPPDSLGHSHSSSSSHGAWGTGAHHGALHRNATASSRPLHPVPQPWGTHLNPGCPRAPTVVCRSRL